MKTINCASLEGIEAIPISVEAAFTKGLPGFSIVGLASSSIQEAKERVKSALIMNGFKFPPLKLTINLSPSDINKAGTFYDLPIALLIALQTNANDDIFKDFFIFGEVGLDGALKDTKDIFVLVLSLAKSGLIKKVFVPNDSIKKLNNIPNIEIYSANNLNEAIDFFQSEKKNQATSNKPLEYKKVIINNQTYYYDDVYEKDFSDVRGQENAIEAALIAVSGNHNIMFEGSPGCGKSMIIKRMQYIMPPMSLEEILEKAKIDSLEKSEPDFSPNRVLRSPHHTSTSASIFGGGSVNAKIGEVALAHNGILFFDELPHFSKNILEALREPLEDNKLLISRVNSKITYPTKFLFASALNPCPCGNLLSQTKECRCSELEIKRYKSKLSDPFFDRIDIFVVMNESSLNDIVTTSSKKLRQYVLKAFSMQKLRGQKELNGKLNEDEIKKYCILDNESNIILEKATRNFSLSFRAINKILKVARTIADLDGSDTIQKNHLLKSISYRKR